MIPQLVKERFAPVPAHPPIQVQDAPLIRAEQTHLPVKIPDLRFWPKNHVDTSAGEVDNEMTFQICQQIFLLGNLFQVATDARALLLSENKALIGEIVERTESLEKEWFGVAEQLCVKVDTFYRSANGFFQQFGPEKRVATKIWNSLMESSPYKDLIPNKMWLMFQGYYFFGNSEEDMFSRYRYSREVDNMLPAIEQLHLTGRDTLKACVSAEIQKIQKEILVEEPEEQVSLLNPNDAVAIDGGDVLQAFLKGRQEEITFLEERNLPLSNANAYLREKKVELMNMDKRFFAVFDRPLKPCFEWVQWSRKMVELFITGPKDYFEYWNGLPGSCKDFPQKCDGIAQHCKVPIGKAGEYTSGYNLHYKFSEHLKEIEPLLGALQKKDTP